MEERKGHLKAVGFCMEGKRKARVIISAAREASRPEEALQTISASLGERIQGPLAEIVERVIERYFSGPKF